MHRSLLASLGVALALTLPAWGRFLHPGLDLWALPDGDGHLTRAIQLAALVREGNWYPRWLPQHVGGYGYPALNYYSPAAYYVLLALAALPAVNLFSAFQIAGAAGALGAIVGVFALAWRTLQHPPAAAVAAVAVAYAPYLIQGNLYDRGALPEVIGLALAVWLLVACHGLWMVHAARSRAPWRAGQRWWWAVVALSAALLLTHNLSALLAAVAALVWIGALMVWRRSWRAAMLAAAGGALGTVLSAFFWLPAVLETSLVQVERMQRGPLHYRNWFLTWPGYHAEAAWGMQSRSPWVPGWPFDLHLVYPHGIYGAPRMSLWQAVALLIAMVAVAMAWRARGVSTLRLVMLVFGLMLALATYALQFDWVLPLWEQYAAVRVLQFPMRLLGLTGYGVSLALAAVVALWPRGSRAGWAVGLTVAGCVALSGGALRPLHFNPERTRSATEDAIIGQQRQERSWSYGESGEFLPKTANWVEWHEGEARGFWLFGRMFPEVSWTGGRVLPWAGDVGVRGLWGGGLWTVVDVEVSSTAAATAGSAGAPASVGTTGVATTVAAVGGGTVAFHQLYFPGWRAWVDGQPVALRPAPAIESQAIEPGFILVDVPPGAHRVAIRFGPDAPRLAAAAISLAALLGIGAYLGLQARRAPGRRGWMSGAAACLVVFAVALCATRLLAPLRAPRGGPAIVATSIAEDVLAGRAGIASPAGGTLAGNPFVQVRPLAVLAQDRPLRDVGPTTRRWLYAHPLSEIAIEVDVPADGYLQTALAMDPAMWLAPLGDGVRFVATVTPVDASGATPTTVLDEWLHPRAFGEQRRWVDVLGDLTPWAGRRVRLALRTEGRVDGNYDWAGWGEPVIVRLDRVTAARLKKNAEYIKSTVLKY
ncbi:MAG: hypothetical protein AVDCRST_MAG77-3879 [uncultured Chloroflexi bacterium]|uniref:Membrane protein 6-pyruvoyl-tetrahydropterin synthase-related domain-containing protein n=1 Tax=uncultured Chloroflexota bacterium TaxID=166587 RepID=A0A6J4JL93_9CHLR|nr:MAG: hypothetical protein AVDCRST_MAG77-3879 [uncultured Chloroflexota bacterium]